MIPTNASSFGRNGGFVRTYPGGTENFSIFETVLALMPNRSAAARSLIPSIRTACRTLAYSLHCLHPPPSAERRQRALNCRSFTPAQPNQSAASVRDYCVLDLVANFLSFSNRFVSALITAVLFAVFFGVAVYSTGGVPTTTAPPAAPTVGPQTTP